MRSYIFTAHIAALSLLLCAGPVLAQGGAEASSARELYQKSYTLLREAKAAASRGEAEEACAKFREARRALQRISEGFPQWNPQAVASRIAVCDRGLKRFKKEKKERPNMLFCGAQGTIFGSCYLLDTGKKKIVIDCGLFSEPEMKRRNLYFPFNPKDVDACVVTHAHVDHLAKLPLLYRKGFQGKTFCSKPTKDMAKTVFKIVNLLRDQVLVPYGNDDIKTALKNIKALTLGKWYNLGEGTRVRLRHTGHILGGVQAEIAFPWEGKEYKLLYAVDTRNPHSPLTPGWERVKSSDWVLIESVYGNRLHGRFEKEFQRFTDLINDAIENNGTVLIPTYSIARTQKVIFFLYKLWREGKLRRKIDIYVDSRIANRITTDHIRNWRFLSADLQRLFMNSINPFDFPGMHEGPPPKSKRGSKIIIAPSAMCDEGTSIVKHLKKYIGDKDSVIIFTGFVLPESIGGQILARKESVEIEGEVYPIRCKAYKVSAFSGHADQNAIVDWFKGFEHVGMVFVIHGLPDGSAALAHRLHDELGLKTYVPRYLERVDLIDFLESPQKPLPRVVSSGGKH